MKFASLVAEGRSYVGAYRTVYEPTNPWAKHVNRNAFRVAHNPAVAAQIQELQRQSLPYPEDAQALQARAIGTLFHLSSPPTRERTRLVAAELLFEISERLQQISGATPSEEPGILADLRRLFRRSMKLGDTGRTLI
jgi:hypothetical protein